MLADRRKEALKLDRLIEIIGDMVPDPRRPGGNLRHKLVEILVIILLGVMSGAETWIDIEDYGKQKETWLRTFLELPNGIPSNDTYRRLMERICTKRVEAMYRAWVLPYVGGCVGKQIAVDGKTICGASNNRKAQEDEALGKIHMISAWIREDGISLGQIKTEEKSNEITAIPQLLGDLDIKGSTVTIDAMGCQTDIAEKIVELEANYVLALKGNQPDFYESVTEYFKWARGDEVEKKSLLTYTYQEGEHGRITRRTVEVTNEIDWLETNREWKGLKSLICIRRKTEKKGQVSEEDAYYISSVEWQSAEDAAKIVQGHWSIENSLHWTMDVSFNEDNCQIYKGNAPQNFSVIRKIAEKLLRSEKSTKKSARRKMRDFLADNDYAEKVLMLLKS